MDEDQKEIRPEAIAFPTFDELEHGSFTDVAQKYRLTELKTARGTLLGVGILFIVVYTALFAFARSMVNDAFDKEVEALLSQGMQVDDAALVELKETDLRARRVNAGGMIGLGVLFCALGFLVPKSPFFSTTTGLVLYVGIQAINASLDWTTIFSGFLFKVLVILALASAVNTAIAYERQVKKARGAVARP